MTQAIATTALNTEQMTIEMRHLKDNGSQNSYQRSDSLKSELDQKVNTKVNSRTYEK